MRSALHVPVAACATQDAKDTELAPIEKLAVQVTPADLSDRVTIIKDVGPVVQALVP